MRYIFSESATDFVLAHVLGLLVNSYLGNDADSYPRTESKTCCVVFSGPAPSDRFLIMAPNDKRCARRLAPQLTEHTTHERKFERLGPSVPRPCRPAAAELMESRGLGRSFV